MKDSMADALKDFTDLCLALSVNTHFRYSGFCKRDSESNFLRKFGAGDGAQTRDLRLGKATLYQLSYSRDHADLVFYESGLRKSIL